MLDLRRAASEPGAELKQQERFLGLLVLALIACDRSLPPAAPALMPVGPTFFNAGPVPYNATITHQFSILNQSMQPVVVNALRSSCGCTRASMDSMDIAPAAEAVLTVEMRMDVTFGRSVFVYVQWTDAVAGEQALQFSLAATVESSRGLSAAPIVMTLVEDRERLDVAMGKSVVTYHSYGPPIADLEIDGPSGVAAKFVERMRSIDVGGLITQEFSLWIELPAGAISDVVEAGLTVRVPARDVAPLHLLVSYGSADSVFLSPAALYYGHIGQNQTRSRSVTVRSEQWPLGRYLYNAPCAPFISLSHVIDDAGEHILTVTVTEAAAEPARSGFINEAVTVFFEGPPLREVVVPVRGIWDLPIQPGR